MCRFPWFYTPAVPGALAPVVATDDMTQEVGVRNCRLYTRPGDAQTQQFEQRLTTVENDVGDLQLDTSDISGDVADLELRVDALEQGGGGGSQRTGNFRVQIGNTICSGGKYVIDGEMVYLYMPSTTPAVAESSATSITILDLPSDFPQTRIESLSWSRFYQGLMYTITFASPVFLNGVLTLSVSRVQQFAFSQGSNVTCAYDSNSGMAYYLQYFTPRVLTLMKA